MNAPPWDWPRIELDNSHSIPCNSPRRWRSALRRWLPARSGKPSLREPGLGTPEISSLLVEHVARNSGLWRTGPGALVP